MRSSLTRLLRVRRLMEEMSRAEFAERRMEQAELEEQRERARETALALRGEARVALLSEAGAATPGLWQRLLADSDASGVAGERWHRAAHAAALEAGEAERKYVEDRRSRMQAEILVRERMAVERLEQDRREQREIDDWFGMIRGAVGARERRSEDSPI